MDVQNVFAKQSFTRLNANESANDLNKTTKKEEKFATRSWNAFYFVYFCEF